VIKKVNQGKIFAGLFPRFHLGLPNHHFGSLISIYFINYMKKIFNSEIFGAFFIMLTALFITFGCFYMKLNNINPRHALNAMIVDVV